MSRSKIAAAITPLIASVLLFVSSQEVLAHASVTSVFPRSGSVITGLDKATITLSEPVSLHKQGVQVVNSKGTVITTSVRVTNENNTLTVTPKARVKPDHYVMRWALVSQDGHIITGSSSFRVGALAGQREQFSIKLRSLSSGSVRVVKGYRTKRVLYLPASRDIEKLEFRSPKFKTVLTVYLKTDSTVVLPHVDKWSVSATVILDEFRRDSLLGEILVSP
jgi:methionine-rich copper-binding protein CopC